jgi:hypothetical protein
MAAVFNITIGGQDFSDIIAHEGLGHEVYKLSDPSTGRTLDGLMHKKDEAVKRKLQFKLHDACPQGRYRALGQALRIEDNGGETPISVTYDDLILGAATEKKFYCSSLKCNNVYLSGDEVLIQGGSFSLEEY